MSTWSHIQQSLVNKFLLKNCTVQIIVPFEEFSGVVKDKKGCSKVESHGASQNLNNNKNLQFYQ